MVAKSIATLTDVTTREQFLELRQRGIGSSEIAAVAGLSRFKNPIAVYYDKVSDIDEELEKVEEEENEFMYWGKKLEGVVADEFAERNPDIEVVDTDEVFQLVGLEWMLASPDRFLLCPKRGQGILEIKTTSAYNAEDWKDGQVPDEYILQVQHQMAVTGCAYAYVAVLIGGNKYQQQLVPRDDEIIDQLVNIGQEFWDRVITRTPPELDGTAISKALLDVLYPEAAPETTVELPPDEADLLLAEYADAERREKDAGQEKEAAKNKLKNLMGNAEAGLVNGVPRVTWTNVATKRLNTDRLKELHPEIYQQYLTESRYRRFTVKKVKGGKK